MKNWIKQLFNMLILCNIIHSTIQIDEILENGSNSEDGYDEILEVSPMPNQATILSTQVMKQKFLQAPTFLSKQR